MNRNDSPSPSDTPLTRQPTAVRGRARRAFSLTELTVVLVAVSLLAVAAIPSYNRFVNRSHDAAASEVVRSVLSHAQSLAASGDRDEFRAADLTRAVDGLPREMWGAASVGVNANDALRFTALLGGTSTEFGEIAAGVSADGSEVAAKMLSRSGACVSGTAPLRGLVRVEVGSGPCDASHTDLDPMGPGADLAPPPCPTGPSLALGDTTVTVTWVASTAPNLAGYDLYVDGADPPTTVGPSATSHEFTGLNNAQTYTFSAVAFDAAGQRSAACALGAGAPAAVAPYVPEAPMLCAGGAPPCLEGDAQVTINWVTPPGETYAGFEVYRDGTLVTALNNPAVRTFTDTGLTNGVTYNYWVVGISPSAVPSPASNVVPLTPQSPSPIASALTPPPVTVVAVEGRETATLAVSWTAVSDADGYRVHVSNVANPPVATVPDGADLAVEIPDLAWGTSYTVWVVAYNTSTDAAGAAVGLTVPEAPAAPTLTITQIPATSAPGTIRVSWGARQSATSYKVTNNDGVELGTAAASPWSHTGRSHNTTYSYRLRACNASGCSNLSPSAAITTPNVPGTPTVSCPTKDVVLPPDMTGCDRYRQLAIRWSAASAPTAAPVTRYEITKCRASCAGWADVGVPTAGRVGSLFAARIGTNIVANDDPLSFVNAFPFRNGDAVATYEVRVRACNAVGCGGHSLLQARPFSNDLYPDNIFLGQERLRRGESLTSVVSNDNFFGPVHSQAQFSVSPESNVLRAYRFRGTNGVWQPWALQWGCGTPCTSRNHSSFTVAVLDLPDTSGVVAGNNSSLGWAVVGARCRTHVRLFQYHYASWAVLQETHHRREHITWGGGYPSGAPYNGAAWYTWAGGYSRDSGVTGWYGCSNTAQALSGGTRYPAP